MNIQKEHEFLKRVQEWPKARNRRLCVLIVVRLFRMFRDDRIFLSGHTGVERKGSLLTVAAEAMCERLIKEVGLIDPAAEAKLRERFDPITLWQNSVDFENVLEEAISHVFKGRIPRWIVQWFRKRLPK